MLRLLMMTALFYTGSSIAADVGLTRSYVSDDAITIAKGLGDLSAAPVLLFVVVDVNSHFATKCGKVASPHELAMNPIVDELVDLKRTNNESTYKEGISRLSCSLFEN
ncbi:hypothetical protein [Klebsiella quasipneumoniae]|uniref:Uncharacterized protein n=1 Tax=Klebsiella quasipneumoniae subsp. quasipneumoniae TaxID=1667327 RepID=A0AAW8XZP2_9ENTR|nr:hypothetical protein [Klebsiella quasipneumoniae]MDV0844963.1 hypothetical protein [Klebsiella quasipneumoniae subsp. quasipneumoniae]